MSLWSFQGARELEPAPQRTPARGPVSQNSTAYASIEVDVVLGELNSRTDMQQTIHGFSAYRHEIPDSLERR